MWVYQRAAQHVCDLPKLDQDNSRYVGSPPRPAPGTICAGDLWRCDDCSTHWLVHEDGRGDGRYWIKATQAEIDARVPRDG